MMNIGMNTTSATRTECIGPLWGITDASPSICSASMSMSGMTDSTSVSGILRFVLTSLAEPLPSMYPSAMWPTAKRNLLLLSQQRILLELLNLRSKSLTSSTLTWSAKMTLLFAASLSQFFERCLTKDAEIEKFTLAIPLSDVTSIDGLYKKKQWQRRSLYGEKGC